MSLDRHHFQLLLALSETGSLGRAAELLSISPSAASHRLKEAERRLGVTLTEPRGRSLRLTGSGSHLADAAAIAEDVLRSGEEISRWLGSTAPATVRLALDFLDRAPWFDLFGGTGRFPFRVDLVRVGFRGVVDAVARHVVDAGIVVVPDNEEEGEFVIARDELAAAVPTNHPAADRGVLVPGEIEEMTYLTTGGIPQPGYEVFGFMQPAGVYPSEFVLIESIWATLQLVAAGRGLTIQPRMALEPAFDGTAVVPLKGVSIPVRWEAVARPDHGPETEDLLQAMAGPVAH